MVTVAELADNACTSIGKVSCWGAGTSLKRPDMQLGSVPGVMIGGKVDIERDDLPPKKQRSHRMVH